MTLANLKYMLANWDDFKVGWERKSPMILDNVCCPYWLAKLRCRPTKAEQRGYAELIKWLKATGHWVDPYDDTCPECGRPYDEDDHD